MTGRPGSLLLRDVALLALLVIAALTPIRSYDYFWHLTTGRWIAEHHALPRSDPFAIASDQTDWIDGEWLFQITAYDLHAVVGDEGLAIARALLVGGLFFFLWKVCAAGSSAALALLMVALAFAGGVGRLDVRPSTAAAVLVVCAILILRRPSSWLRDALFAMLTVVWINVHPSALLAPVVAGVVAVLAHGEEPSLGVRLRVVVMSALALLINPYGAGAIEAPLRLAAFARGGTFVNAEWLPSSPVIFPLLYLSLALGLLSYAATRRWRHDASSLVLFLFFGVLAVRFVRNQGLYFATFPILIPMLDRGTIDAALRKAVAVVAVALVGWVAMSDVHVAGVDRSRFPVAAVDRLLSNRLAGNIYNPDQFGGYLMWRLYPERRVLTDGRNELYHHYIAQYARARLDGRAWHALLDQYQIALAVDEYHRERMTVIDAVTGRQQVRPASQIYFPRKQWALVAFDEVGMVFARRSRFRPQVLAALEYRVLVPDDEPDFGITSATRSAAVLEVQRALREIGVRPITAEMNAAIAQGR
jgi:hypothetical protein